MTIDFSEYLIKDGASPVAEEPGILKEAPRHAARSTSRVAETIAGLPEDISNLASSGLNWIGEKLGLPSQEKITSQVPKLLGFPGAKSFREKEKKYMKGYLEPQTEGEKTADEFLQLATSLALPGPKTVAAKKVIHGIGKAGSLAALATGTKEGLKAFGVDDDTANVASFAALAIPGLIKGKNPREVASRLYKEAEQLLPSDAMISSHGIVPKMESTIKILEQGTSTPSKSAALKAARDVIEKGRSGMVNVNELTAFKRDVNELMKDPAMLRRSEKFLPQIGKEVDNLIEAYGKAHPEWIQKYRLANHMYGSLERSKKAANTLFKMSKYVKNPLTLTLLGMLPEVGLMKAAVGGASLLATKKGYEMVHRVFTSPSLRRHYGQVIKEATKGNSKATIQLLKKFDQEVDRDFPNWDQYRVQ